MTDNYEYMKASTPQDINEYSPYVDKQYNNYINDLNSGVYTNNGISLVQFDLGQIYNSTRWTLTNDLFLAIPITVVSAYSTGSALVPPVDGNYAQCCLKPNFVNLIHQADLQVNGKSIESTQPFVNIAKHFQMLSEMSINDLGTIGYTLGFPDVMDNTRSMIWNAGTTTAGSSGNGLTNNRPFNSSAGTGTRYQTSAQTAQNTGCCNDAIQSKISRIIDTTATGSGFNKIGATILTTNQLANEFKPYYTVLGTNYMVWYDVAIIKLSTIFESLENMGLVKKADINMRFWINTGTTNITVANPNSTTPGYGITTANNNFTNTCPLLVNYLNAASASGGIPATVTNIVAGVFISKPPTTSVAAVNLSLSGASHPMTACRIYYSQIMLSPEKTLQYESENTNKKVIYRTLLTNQYNNTGAGGNFNQLISSGVVHPTGILIVPFISQSIAQASGLGLYGWQSPFDPSFAHPISITNLQVSVGGVNMLNSTLFYTYENFIEQVNLAEQLTSSDFGVTVGLFNQQFWEYNRYYYVNIERSAPTDKLNPRNINVSFTNNSSLAIDVLVFVFYADEFTIDVITGNVKKGS